MTCLLCLRAINECKFFIEPVLPVWLPEADVVYCHAECVIAFTSIRPIEPIRRRRLRDTQNSLARSKT